MVSPGIHERTNAYEKQLIQIPERKKEKIGNCSCKEWCSALGWDPERRMQWWSLARRTGGLGYILLAAVKEEESSGLICIKRNRLLLECRSRPGLTVRFTSVYDLKSNEIDNDGTC